jgi:hypothetical protein
MTIDITAIITQLIRDHGPTAAVTLAVVYYIQDLGKKIDILTNLNNKTFGVMLALVDKGKRDSFGEKGDG